MTNATRLDQVRTAAAALVAKLDVIHENPAYKSVWTLAHVHGGYNGPNYAEELKALRAVLAADYTAGGGEANR